MGDKQNEQQRVNIRVSEQVMEYFRDRKDKTNVPMSAQMALVLHEYVERQINKR